MARSRLATTYAWYRGPQSWTSDWASQLDARIRSTRAWIERSAARGMLSCRPAQAARSREFVRLGSRSSRAPTRCRNERICGRVRIRRELFMSTLLLVTLRSRYNRYSCEHQIPPASPVDYYLSLRRRGVSPALWPTHSRQELATELSANLCFQIAHTANLCFPAVISKMIGRPACGRRLRNVCGH